MKTANYFIPLTAALLLCGCNKQAKINSEKIQILSQNIIQFEQNQNRQMQLLQSELTSLAPMLDKMDSAYFEKNRDDALFFHTNTLYLLLTLGQQIESQLQAADATRNVDSALARAAHTNEMDAIRSGTAQIQNTMSTQAGRMENTVNEETRRVAAALGDEIVQQIKSSAPDADEIARQKQMAADISQMKQEIDQIKAQLGHIASEPLPRP
jgi:hypothetical protein